MEEDWTFREDDTPEQKTERVDPEEKRREKEEKKRAKAEKAREKASLREDRRIKADETRDKARQEKILESDKKAAVLRAEGRLYKAQADKRRYRRSSRRSLFGGINVKKATRKGKHGLRML